MDALHTGKEYDQVHLIYNEFVSAVAYTASIKTITPLLDGMDFLRIYHMYEHVYLYTHTVI
jgi:F0F1-type ATP synthase gamma subunit